MMKLVNKENGKKVARFYIKGTVELDYEYLDYALKHWVHWEKPKFGSRSEEEKREMFSQWVQSYVLTEGMGMLENTCVGLEDLALEELRHGEIKKAKKTIKKLAG